MRKDVTTHTVSLRLTAEVEHSLTTTQEMNVNLQILLEKALNSQKQSNASTNHVVRNIQSDVSKVFCRFMWIPSISID
jgi:hypothetical protein